MSKLNELQIREYLVGIPKAMSVVPEKQSGGRVRRLRVSGRGSGADFAKAMFDFSSGFALWPLWLRLGWNDILQRYRRSVLGPFWLTASMAIMVISLGVLYAELFNT